MKRGFSVQVAHDVPGAIALAGRETPAYAIVDLVMPGRSGLELVAALCACEPRIKVVVVTGYANIATAVEAIKLGAIYYLTKPTDADEIVATFERDAGERAISLPEIPISLERLEWEYIQRALTECGGNVSAAARRLGMHRRTLQRKLHKVPRS